jgi:glutaredoxin
MPCCATAAWRRDGPADPALKRAHLMLALGAALCAAAADAQIYKWKDSRGVTHFSDLPPPPSVTASEMKTPAVTAGGGPELPYQLAEAVKNYPVTLYTAPRCAPCDQGRALLQARGIPYTEKTIVSAADHAALNQAGGANQLPLLLVGRQTQVGFETGAWEAALTAAAYPAQRMLPPGYRPAPPQPAAPAANSEAAPGQDAPSRRENLPKINPNPGFQF